MSRDKTLYPLAMALLIELKPLELAAMWDCSEQHVRRLIRAGRLRARHRKRPGRAPFLVVPGWSVLAYQDEEAGKMLRDLAAAAKAKFEEEKESG